MRKCKIIYLFIIKVLWYTILLLNIILFYLIFIIIEYFQSQNIYYVTAISIFFISIFFADFLYLHILRIGFKRGSSLVHILKLIFSEDKHHCKISVLRYGPKISKQEPLLKSIRRIWR